MKILAIDSSGLVASAAVVTQEALLAEYTINYKKTHSQTLLPMIDELVRMLELELSDLDAIAVAKGPGSFTGLRIGSATAKGLGLALSKPVIGIPTVDAIAYNLFGTKSLICPLMDARRNQVYTGLYTFCKEEFQIIKQQMAAEIKEIIEMINNLQKPVIFLGDGVEVYKESIKEQIAVPYLFAPIHLAKQRAAAVGALAVSYYTMGRMQSAALYEPVYLRLSQAERELMEKQNK